MLENTHDTYPIQYQPLKWLATIIRCLRHHPPKQKNTDKNAGEFSNPNYKFTFLNSLSGIQWG